jgi:hypothetical protein
MHGFSRHTCGLQAGAATTFIPPLHIRKTLVYPGPGIEPVVALEATSPRSGDAAYLIRALPFYSDGVMPMLPCHFVFITHARLRLGSHIEHGNHCTALVTENV